MATRMSIEQAIEVRHSIRRYSNKLVDEALLDTLEAFVDECNRESGLRMQLMRNEKQGFKGIVGRFNFTGVNNYLALVGPDGDTLDETCGYYGEKVLLEAVRLGLGTCWFGGGFKQSAIDLKPGERGVIAIALGYADQEGKVHKSKELSTLTVVEGAKTPEWFIRGARAAQLAPTARNQQSFRLTLLANDGNEVGVQPRVKAESLGGMFSKLDLGIIKYHFEVAAGVDTFSWA